MTEEKTWRVKVSHASGKWWGTSKCPEWFIRRLREAVDENKSLSVVVHKEDIVILGSGFLQNSIIEIEEE